MPEQLIKNRDLSFNDLIAEEYRDLLWLAWDLMRVMNENTSIILMRDHHEQLYAQMGYGAGAGDL